MKILKVALSETEKLFRINSGTLKAGVSTPLSMYKN